MRLSGRGFACERHASRSNFKAERQRRRTICRLDRCRVSGWRLPPRRNDVIGGGERHVLRGLASGPALKGGRSVGDGGRAGGGGGLGFFVLDAEVIFGGGFAVAGKKQRS